jgi:hypothetical protein
MSTKQQWFSLFRRSTVVLGAASAAAGALLAFESSAEAQSRFGDKGTLAITADNLFRLGTERFGDTQVNGDTSTTVNRVGFLYTHCGDVPSPRCPQIGGHYFIIPSLSLGANLGYESRGGSHTRPQGPNGVLVTTDSPDQSALVFIPQVGYAMMFGAVVGFWLRGGLGYFHDGSSQPGTEAHSYWFLKGNADLVITPFPNFAINVGPQFDLGFSGSRTETNNQGVQTSWNASYRDFGLGVGIMGFIGL